MKYIRENRNSYTIVKASKTYAKITNLDDAIFIRDFLVENDWDLNKTPLNSNRDLKSSQSNRSDVINI